MWLTIPELSGLACDAMLAIDYTEGEANLIADHLVDCELRGLAFGGLSRAISLVEADRARPEPRRPLTVVRETPVSAKINGGNQLGYVVAHRATEIAIAKTRQTGVALVGAVETVYTGMLSYYLEMATRRGFVAIAASSSGNFAAPYGGTEGRFGTNPIAFGFPSAGEPVIWDAGTSSIMLSEVVRCSRVGEQLPPGKAYDIDGSPTSDPIAALAGALTVWGGAKGSGLAITVQLLGMMCGADAMPPRTGGIGFFMLVLDPALLTDSDDYQARVSDYADLVRATRPLDPTDPVRMPFDRSREQRRRAVEAGGVDVDARTVGALRQAISG
jgi:LDH2 family malate/lactate/ureidoglycolate dehydrogenase